MKKADFHVHTNYSDGVFSPEKIVDTAIDAGLEAIALTDHDNILSYEIAQNYLKNLGKQDKLEIIQGVEVNTLYKNYEVHILGYFMNTENEDFKKLLKIQQQARIDQVMEIIDLLDKKEGIKITFDMIKSQVADGGSIGRPHIAKAITSAGGTSSVIEAYNKYINAFLNICMVHSNKKFKDSTCVFYSVEEILAIHKAISLDYMYDNTILTINNGKPTIVKVKLYTSLVELLEALKIPYKAKKIYIDNNIIDNPSDFIIDSSVRSVIVKDN